MDLSGATWRKSTRSSGGGNGDCVEVATLDATVGDSKDIDGAVLHFGADSWSGFIAALTAGNRETTDV